MIKNFLTESFKNLFETKPKSNLVKHAERELALIGYDDKDEYNNMAKQSILELIETFAKQGHSGFSANYVADIFNKLVRYQTLSPLTGNDDEWNEILDNQPQHGVLFQNNRNSAVFKTDKECYYLDAIVWIDETGCSFTNRKSRGYIKSFPFTPKTFYVHVDANDVIIDTEEHQKALDYYHHEQNVGKVL